MNATAEQLDLYLQKADPASANAVEQMVRSLLERFKPVPPQPGQPAARPYKMKTYSMGTFLPGIDSHKLGQLPEDF